MIGDLRMEVTHLAVLLNIEAILHIPPNTQATVLINRNNPISLRTFKHMQLDYTFLRGHHNTKLGQAHLKHHVFLEQKFLPNHYKAACCASNIT